MGHDPSPLSLLSVDTPVYGHNTRKTHRHQGSLPVVGAQVIFVLFFKLLSTFQVVYNVYSVVRNERKCVSATKLQKLLWKGSGKPMVAKVPAFRAGGALDSQEPGKAAVGPVRPQGLAQSCGTAGLTEPSGPPLCQSPELPSPPHPPQEDWVGHSRCGQWRNQVRVPGKHQVASVVSGECSGHGRDRPRTGSEMGPGLALHSGVWVGT